MVQTASYIIGLGLRVSTSGSMTLTLVGSQCAQAWCRGLLEWALLGEVSRLATSVAPAALAAVSRVECVAVTSGEVPA
jgi:hypothetical protein